MSIRQNETNLTPLQGLGVVSPSEVGGRIFILADDITGAAEIAGVCLRYGLPVSFGINRLPETANGITVISTDSRSIPEEDAYQIHKNLTHEIISAFQKPVLYKKCDSALRGYILAELSAMMEVTEKKTVLLQPANPAAERYILNGNYLIGDKLIENTGFAVDPDFPAMVSSVKDLLLSRNKNNVSAISLHTGKSAGSEIKDITVPDCGNIGDMQKALNQFSENEMLICGSSAFFEQFLLHQFPDLKRQNAPTIHVENNFVLISGSTHPESRQFTDELKLKGCPVILFPESLLQAEINEQELRTRAENLISVYNKENKLAVRIAEEPLKFDGSALILKKRLTSVVKILLENINPEYVFIEGGATTYDILQEMKRFSLIPEAELASGVISLKSPADKFLLIIKPGSYRWPEGMLLSLQTSEALS